MWLLGRRLAAAGYRTRLFGYSVSLEPFADIVDRWVDHVTVGVDEDGGVGWAVVGHSLGNLITRAAADRLPGGWRAMAMIAPPNRSPAAARALQDVPVFKLVTRDTGDRLRREGWASELPPPPVPTLVIAGDAGPRQDWLPLGQEPNDGLVTVEETRLEGARHVVVPALHTFLMNRRDVTEEILRFFAETSDSSGRVAGGSA